MLAHSPCSHRKVKEGTIRLFKNIPGAAPVFHLVLSDSAPLCSLLTMLDSASLTCDVPRDPGPPQWSPVPYQQAGRTASFSKPRGPHPPLQKPRTCRGTRAAGTSFLGVWKVGFLLPSAPHPSAQPSPSCQPLAPHGSSESSGVKGGWLQSPRVTQLAGVLPPEACPARSTMACPGRPLSNHL